jgi:diacylglycerol kinase family enzyme
VRGALEAAGLQHTLHVTQRAGHATQLLAGLDLQGLSAVVFMGGDGTVHEGLQVIMETECS